jgi:uncharacterized protein (UPF0333 family)
MQGLYSALRLIAIAEDAVQIFQQASREYIKNVFIYYNKYEG